MAKVSFKAKPYEDLTPEWKASGIFIIPVPKLQKRHCDMDAFRKHPKYGAYANSDLFPAMLRREQMRLFPYSHIRTDNIPEGVEIDRSGFLWEVSFNL